MPKSLLDRCQPDSIREFRAAARQRFRDAEQLEQGNCRTAAIYLWGYSGEMILKAAYFAVIGYGHTQPITLADLRAAAQTAPSLGVSWPGLPGNPKLHDLRAWAQLLVASRAVLPGLDYADSNFGDRVVKQARVLQRFWSETLRYRKNLAYEYEVKQVRDAANWLLLHSLDL